MRAKDLVYHLDCFICNWCQIRLNQGDYFGLKGRLVYCRTHYEMLPPGLNSGTYTPFPAVHSGPGNYFLSSENAIHPVGDLLRSPNDPIIGIPAYGSIFGSPGGNLNGVGGVPGAGMAGGPSAPVVSNTTTGVRKGRPRKRKTPLNGPDGSSPSNCSMLDGGLNGLNGVQSRSISGKFFNQYF